MRDERNSSSFEQEREFDLHLDAALRSYAASYARPGLEDRLLRHIEASGTHTHVRAWARARVWTRTWSLAAVAALLFCGFVLVVQRHAPVSPGNVGLLNPHDAAVSFHLVPPPTATHEGAGRSPAGRTRRVTAEQAWKHLEVVHAGAAAWSRPLPTAPLSEQERLMLQLAGLPESPLAYQEPSQPITIEPLQISALVIAPIVHTSANTPNN
ncbi:hypothetical protein [Acidipila sp. EB88]|uniref:hypothetical protein n=1 Tax=Acidipila sp. EB88 TaxID=2305226 RepID=UPI000F5F8114|nr:hypothetical protein [Acidipila sp. EB88]RRA48037.1 hypothetical protein D1Y84_06780 [Acidipila sp. EB88]